MARAIFYTILVFVLLFSASPAIFAQTQTSQQYGEWQVTVDQKDEFIIVLNVVNAECAGLGIMFLYNVGCDKVRLVFEDKNIDKYREKYAHGQKVQCVLWDVLREIKVDGVIFYENNNAYLFCDVLRSDFDALVKFQPSPFVISLDENKSVAGTFSSIMLSDVAGYDKAYSVAQDICSNFYTSREEFKNLGKEDWEKRLERHEKMIQELMQ
ncbi:MAG: hypothetical protein LBR22_03595 [Desulfovibrio sp.]|jgi:hypothetical protein|nr:hypothetical protein [Desulfovibrio sp.]